jgi:septum site-determining protein MinD
MIKGKIIGVISLKGGVGKTTTVANLGYALSDIYKKKVLVVDANFSAPNLGLHLGLVRPSATLHDVMNGKSNPEDAIYRYNSSLDILPGAYISKNLNPLLLRKKIKPLAKFYDYILLDSSPNLNSELQAAMAASDELLVVASPDFPTLSTTLRAIRVAKQKRTPITGLILNKVYNKNFEISIDDIEEAAQVPVISVITHDIKIPKSISESRPASLAFPGSNSWSQYSRLAANIVGQEFKETGLSNVIDKINNYAKSLFNTKKN